MKVCDSCSMVNREDALRCANCGASLPKTVAAQSPPSGFPPIPSPQPRQTVPEGGGAPPKAKRNPRIYLLMAVIGVLLLCLALFSTLLLNQRGTDWGDTELQLSAVELSSAYEVNREQAESLYHHAIIQLTGKFAKQKGNDLYLERETTGGYIRCRLARGENNNLPDLQPGDVIRIAGRVQGISGDIQLTDCRFLSLVERAGKGKDVAPPSQTQPEGNTTPPPVTEEPTSPVTEEPDTVPPTETTQPPETQPETPPPTEPPTEGTRPPESEKDVSQETGR